MDRVIKDGWYNGFYARDVEEYRRFEGKFFGTTYYDEFAEKRIWEVTDNKVRYPKFNSHQYEVVKRGYADSLLEAMFAIEDAMTEAQANDLESIVAEQAKQIQHLHWMLATMENYARELSDCTSETCISCPDCPFGERGYEAIVAWEPKPTSIGG